MYFWLKFEAQCDYEIMKKHHQDHLLLDIFIGWHFFSFEEYELHNREDFESQEEILKWTVLLDSAEKTHLGRKASVTVENLKYSFRNRLKA